MSDSDGEGFQLFDSEEESTTIYVDDKSIVSVTHRCQSKNAKKLKIYNLSHNIKVSNDYSIGGTYNDKEPELWFYFTSSSCFGTAYLFNLFVCHRKVGNFAIGVSRSNEINKVQDTSTLKLDVFTLTNTLTWYSFKTVKPNQSHFIKTFYFPGSCFEASVPVFVIPISINTNPPIVSDKILKKIKLKHDFSQLLSKELKTDLILQSASKEEYPTYKLAVAAHSEVLKNMIKNLKEPVLFLDISDEEMDTIMEFICTGTIRKIKNRDCLKLLDLAYKFQLNNMLILVQSALETKLCIDNAVELAVLTEKHKLQDLQAKVFRFIKKHPEVLDTPGWSNLNDINLTKKLFQFIYKSISN